MHPDCVPRDPDEGDSVNCSYCWSLGQKPANCVNCGAPIMPSVAVIQERPKRGPWTFALIWQEDMMSGQRLFLLLASKDRREIEDVLGELAHAKGLEHFGNGTPPMWGVPSDKMAEAIRTGVAKWSASPYDLCEG